MSPPLPSGVRDGDATPAGPRGGDDVTRRTFLANERTYLAWWRTGIAALTAGVGIGRIVPSLTHQHRVPYAILGAGFAIVGIAALLYGLRRHREVVRALERGEYTYPSESVLIAFTVTCVLLGLLLLTVVVVAL